jgi:hypothetical protein
MERRKECKEWKEVRHGRKGDSQGRQEGQGRDMKKVKGGSQENQGKGVPPP